MVLIIAQVYHENIGQTPMRKPHVAGGLYGLGSETQKMTANESRPNLYPNIRGSRNNEQLLSNLVL